MVLVIDSDNKDVQVWFIHPHYPSSSYKWPVRDDECWVPENHVIATTETPSLSTVTGCQYKLSNSDIESLEKPYGKWKIKGTVW